MSIFDGRALLLLVALLACCAWLVHHSATRIAEQSIQRPRAGADLVYECATCQRRTRRNYTNGLAFVDAAQNPELNCDECDLFARLEADMAGGAA